jgi:hypothetical protein
MFIGTPFNGFYRDGRENVYACQALRAVVTQKAALSSDQHGPDFLNYKNSVSNTAEDATTSLGNAAHITMQI